jgi:zinc transporter ZupT
MTLEFEFLMCEKPSQNTFFLLSISLIHMFKRLAISFCLLVAFAMLQAHNFIPHHHEIEPVEANHHHDHDENDDNDHDSPFTDLTHNADFGKVIAKPQTIKEIVEKPVFAGGFFIVLYNRLTSFESPPEYHPPDDDSALHLIFLSHSLPLRAPPTQSFLS